jgi:hypothetical protein
MSKRIENLRTVIQTMHGCKSAHVQSVPVVGMLEIQTVCGEVVGSFSLNGHLNAKRCYAWSHQDNGEAQYLNFWKIQPVVSPKTAVQAAIVSDSQKSEKLHGRNYSSQNFISNLISFQFVH